MRIAVFALFVLLLAAATGQSVTAADKDVLLELQTKWELAYLTRDTTFVERLTDESLVFIGPEGNAVGKSDYVQGIAGPTQFNSFTSRDINVRVFGDTAVVTGVAVVRGSANGAEFSGEFAFGNVFVRKNGGWKLVSGQVTPITKD